MADILRRGEALWRGGLLDGSGTVSTGSGALKNVPYAVRSRFESGPGTNPEELLAAAHAGCFSMMLAKLLGDRHLAPQSIHTQAALTLSQRDGGWKITSLHLDTEVHAPGLDEATLKSLAQTAAEQCPVSTLLKPGLDSLTHQAQLRR